MAIATVEEQDLERVLKQYDKIAASFAESGLDLEAIAEVRPRYAITDKGTWPHTMGNLPEPLPDGSSRLCVLPLSHSPGHVAAISDIVKSIRDLLPPRTDVFCNPAELLHITLFHCSHPHDPRPQSLNRDESFTIAKQPPSQRRAPTRAEIDAEIALMPKILGDRAVDPVKVVSIQMAGSGVLLMLSADYSGSIHGIRSRFQACVPGCPTKQTNIVHSSLMRILTPEQLSLATRQAIQQRCQDWTEHMRGTQLNLPEAWYIVEEDYANIRGKTYGFDVPTASEKPKFVRDQNYTQPQCNNRCPK
ncbi:g4850 [Coccomyxa viridis]|uniref:G4850 protein n=1 Tax=Coccomyxa viridis TaxID=1274662 RepID=A0ABP1FWA1_9CHLO